MRKHIQATQSVGDIIIARTAVAGRSSVAGFISEGIPQADLVASLDRLCEYGVVLIEENEVTLAEGWRGNLRRMPVMTE